MILTPFAAPRRRAHGPLDALAPLLDRNVTMHLQCLASRCMTGVLSAATWHLGCSQGKEGLTQPRTGTSSLLRALNACASTRSTSAPLYSDINALHGEALCEPAPAHAALAHTSKRASAPRHPAGSGEPPATCAWPALATRQQERQDWPVTYLRGQRRSERSWCAGAPGCANAHARRGSRRERGAPAAAGLRPGKGHACLRCTYR